MEMKRKKLPRYRQLLLTFEAKVAENLSTKDRVRAVSLLAQLLLEASGKVEKETANERR
jgi:hypothetical protein